MNYIYWLFHCPLASGYFYKHKKIAAVIMVFRVYNDIKASLIHPHHQSTVNLAPPAIKIVLLSKLKPALTVFLNMKNGVNQDDDIIPLPAAGFGDWVTIFHPMRELGWRECYRTARPGSHLSPVL